MAWQSVAWQGGTGREGRWKGKKKSCSPLSLATLTIFLLLSAICSSDSISTSLLTEVLSSRSSYNSGSCKRRAERGSPLDHSWSSQVWLQTRGRQGRGGEGGGEGGGHLKKVKGEIEVPCREAEVLTTPWSTHARPLATCGTLPSSSTRGLTDEFKGDFFFPPLLTFDPLCWENFQTPVTNSWTLKLPPPLVGAKNSQTHWSEF